MKSLTESKFILLNEMFKISNVFFTGFKSLTVILSIKFFDKSSSIKSGVKIKRGIALSILHLNINFCSLGSTKVHSLIIFEAAIKV